MITSLESQIRTQLEQYLAGSIDFETFDCWMTQYTWDQDIPLRYTIELRVAEYTGGYLTEKQLRTELQSIFDLGNAIPVNVHAMQTTGNTVHLTSLQGKVIPPWSTTRLIIHRDEHGTEAVINEQTTKAVVAVVAV